MPRTKRAISAHVIAPNTLEIAMYLFKCSFCFISSLLAFILFAYSPLQAADLEAGKPWRVRVEQLGIDVVVEVKDLLGHSLLTVGAPTPAEQGPGNGRLECSRKNSRLQRRGRPGFAPKFPVRRPGSCPQPTTNARST